MKTFRAIFSPVEFQQQAEEKAYCSKVNLVVNWEKLGEMKENIFTIVQTMNVYL